MRKNTEPYYLVIGLGASGLSMARFLKARGKHVIATDIDQSAKKNAQICMDLGIETQIGFHDQKTFNKAAFLVPSPGIPLTTPYIENAVRSGVQVTGELDIFSEHNRLPVIAITGTNGKTTTTTLVGQLLAACGKKPFVGGNIGTPLVEQLLSEDMNDIIVAEISSFQLDISNHFKPDIGLLLNISEDHLDRYKGFNAYADSKWGLFKNQDMADIAIINRQINGFSNRSKKMNAAILSFSSGSTADDKAQARILRDCIEIQFNDASYRIDTTELGQLRGEHNLENLAAAVLACLAAGCTVKDIKAGILKFKNLPHRLEWVANIGGVDFYNDSKATNIDAVIRALACFENKIVLILGGREKGTDFSLLTDAVKNHCKTIMAIGEARSNIKKTFDHLCEVIEVETMEKAVLKGFQKADQGETVLLSPACASFDMYDNYAHRGNDFKTITNRIKEQENV